MCSWVTAGQEKAVELLRRSLRQGRLSHAYLLVGPEHVGKMTLALDLARAVNCDSAAPPCGQCRSCQRIASGMHADVQALSVASVASVASGASGEQSARRRRTEIGRDSIKDVIEMASLPPFEGKKKVFIIDGAERMSAEAANTLLKTLEEPAATVLFVLLCSREQALLPTVASRCQRLELRPMAPEAVERLLAAGGTAAPQATLLARLSAGCPGWALAAAGDEGVLAQRSQELSSLMGIPALSFAERLDLVAEWTRRFESREDLEAQLRLWLGWWRDLVLVKAGCPSAVTNVDCEEDLRHQGARFDIRDATEAAQAIRRVLDQLAMNVNLRLALEFLMLSIPRSEERVRSS